MSHKDMIVKLDEKAGQVKDGIPRSKVSELQARYDKLQQECKVGILLVPINTVLEGENHNIYLMVLLICMSCKWTCVIRHVHLAVG